MNGLQTGRLAYPFLLSFPGCPTPQRILVYSGSGEYSNFCKDPVLFHLLCIKVKDQELPNCIRVSYSWEKKIGECFQKHKVSLLTESSLEDKIFNVRIFPGENSGLEFQSRLCVFKGWDTILDFINFAHRVYCLTRDIQILTCFYSYCLLFLSDANQTETSPDWDINVQLFCFIWYLITFIHKRTQN